jgi:putative transposase
VAKRVSPTDRLRAEVEELFGSGRDLAAILEDVARLSVRLMMQTALEAQVAAVLGRAVTSAAIPMTRPATATVGSHRPPCTPRWVTSELQRPKLRSPDEAFCSRCSAPV